MMLRLFVTGICAWTFAAGGFAAESTPLIPADGAGSVSGAWKTTDNTTAGNAEGGAAIWMSPGEYRDAEVSVRFNVENPGARAGVLLRAHRLEKMSDPSQQALYGYRINIDPAAKDGTAGILEENGRGRLAFPSIDAQEAVVQGWNTLEASAKGDVIEVRLNGVIACRLQDEAFTAGRIALIVEPPDGQEKATVQFEDARVNDLGDATAWKSLFDGKTLVGWKEWGSEKWTVVDGTIQGRRGPKNSEGYLATEKIWSDFRVRGEFKMLGDGNYGLFYHSRIKPKDDGYPVISGVQGEVMPGRPAETGRLYESYRRGWLMPKNHTDIGSWALREGEWNSVEIRSRGNHATTWVNGIRVIDLIDPAPQVFEGSFALQLHTGDGAGIDWRGLYVEE